MREPIWITESLASAVHERQLAEHGGTPGIRDMGGLTSALSRAIQKWAYGREVDIPVLAGAYAFGIARNHPFVDGNKRTAYVVCRTFLVLNGWDLVGPLSERYPIIMSLAAGEIDEEEFVAWLRTNARPEEVSEEQRSYG